MGTPVCSWTTEALAAWSQVATLAVALLAIIAGFYQLRIHKNIGREADAQQSFRDFLSLAITYPDLASGKKPSTGQLREKEQYEWFVAYMLAAFEKIIAVGADDEEWKEALKLNLKYHTTYLSDSSRFTDEQLGAYDKGLRTLIYLITNRPRLKKDGVVQR